MLFLLLRFLLLFSLSMPILATRNFTFSKVNDRSQLPHRMRQMVRVEWDGSTTVQYGRTSPQSLNLYFALPAAPRPSGAVPLPSPVTFTVTIDSLDACTCVTQSVYDNIFAFAWNRRFADRILPEEVVYLTWNLWQSGNSSADNDGRSVYFSATDFNGFGNADGPSSWTILSGGQRRARVTLPVGNGSLMLEYGSRLALLYTVPHGKVRRHLSFRLISQRELLQLHPWLGSQLSAGRTPRCDWALNFSSKYRLLFPTNGTLEADRRRRRNERIDDGQRGNEADNNGIEHCSRK